MTFDTRPPGPADLVPSALRTAMAQQLLTEAGMDGITTKTFAANHANLGGYTITGRIGKRIGVTLPEEFRLAPEQSTTAPITHHREASDFST